MKAGKESKVPKRKDDKDVIDKLQARLQAATLRKEKATETEDKLSAANEIDEVKAEIKKVNNVSLFKHQHRLFDSDVCCVMYEGLWPTIP